MTTTTHRLPLGQKNAHLDDGLVMRVGVPHKGGRLASHAFNAGYPVMVSANAFWNAKAQEFKFPEYTDLSETDMALDSAGFSAVRLWQSRGTQPGMAGIYPWSYEQYLELVCTSGASWCSAPDLCCESEIAGSEDEINWRIDATATMLEGCMRILYSWQNELSKRCNANTVANMVPIVTPIVQGFRADQYERSLELTMKVWERWMPWVAPPALIGVGSVCRRSLRHPQHGLLAILDRLESIFPESAKAHLFGIKGAALDDVKMRPWVGSCDSMAFDFGARVAAREQKLSNTIAHRQEHMDAWMATAAKRMAPASGDQFRLF